MAEGEVGAVVHGLAEEAGGELADSLAKLTNETADKEEANLAKILDEDAKAGRDIEDAGKPGEDPGDCGGPPSTVKPPTYENPGHHDPNGGPNPYNSDKAVLPPDAQEYFAKSIQVGPARWAKVGEGKSAVYYRYSNTGNDVWHWSGSTIGVNARGVPMPIALRHVPIQVRRM